MQYTAVRFKESSTRLKNAMWWQNQRFCIGITVLLVAIITIIIVVETNKTKDEGGGK